MSLTDTQSPAAEVEARKLADRIDATADRLKALRAGIGQIIFGQETIIEQTLISILAGGHVLLIGVPGLAKTKLVETLGIGLGLDAKFAQARTGIMVGDGAVVAGGNLIDAEHVDQEGHQLVTAAGQVLGPDLHGRIVVEQPRIVMAQHPPTGAGGRHHGIVAFEGLDDLDRDRPRRGAVSAVVGGLAAADLKGRHFDRTSGLLEELDRGKADRRPEQVDEAGDEKRDAARAGGRF